MRSLHIILSNLRTRRRVSNKSHCVKSVRIRSYSGLYSVRMRENMDENNSKYRHLSRSANGEFPEIRDFPIYYFYFKRISPSFNVNYPNRYIRLS